MKKISFVASLFLVSVLFVQNVQAKDYQEGTVLRSTKTKILYYVDKDQIRHLVPNLAVLKTWVSNYKIINVPNSEVWPPITNQILWGKPLPVKVGTKLVKFENSPTIYLTDSSFLYNYQTNTLLAIPDGKTVQFIYGLNWNKNIIELPEIYSLFYNFISLPAVANPDVVDNDPPAVSVTAMPFSSLLPDTIKVVAKASDNVVLKKLNIFINGAKGDGAQDRGAGCVNSSFQSCDEVQLTISKSQLLSYEAVAIDLKGNSNSTGVIQFQQ